MTSLGFHVETLSGDSSCLDDGAQDGAARSAIGAGAAAAAKDEAADCRFVLTEALTAALRLAETSSSAAAPIPTATTTSSSPATAAAASDRRRVSDGASALASAAAGTRALPAVFRHASAAAGTRALPAVFRHASAAAGTRALPAVFRHAEQLTHAFADRTLSSGGGAQLGAPSLSAAHLGAPSLSAAQLGAFHSQSRVWALQRACIVTGRECTLPLVPPPVWTKASAPEQLTGPGGWREGVALTWRGQPPSNASTWQLLALGMALGLGASALLAVRGRRRLRTRRRAAGMEARSV